MSDEQTENNNGEIESTEASSSDSLPEEGLPILDAVEIVEALEPDIEVDNQTSTNDISPNDSNVVTKPPTDTDTDTDIKTPIINETQDVSANHLSTQTFSNLDICEPVLKGIKETGFDYCTPIQALALPIALGGKDVAGQAQTGTGKTAAFLIATFHHLLKTEIENKPTSQLRALILAPTRELAIQIYEDAKPLNMHTGLKLGLAYGGTDYQKQREQLEAGVDVLIGTPGRIIDYFKQGVFNIKKLEVMVLDEADRMFDLGFINDIRYLFRSMSPAEERLSLMFSATLSLRVKELAYEHMASPESVVVETDRITAELVTEKAYLPSNPDKLPLLMGLLQAHAGLRCLVFINTKRMAEKIQATLNANGFENGMLSGDVPQRKRESLLKKFKSGEVNTLIATDVAARGLHISDVGLVINFDLPQDAEDYVHRIGRTARAGATGVAISLICETFGMHAADIEKYTGHKLPVERNYEDLLVKDMVIVEPPRRDKQGTRETRPDARKNSSTPKPASRVQKPKVAAIEPVKLKDPKTAAQSKPLRSRISRIGDVPAVG